MKSFLPLVIVIVLVVLALGGCAMSGYNRVIGMDEQVKSAWAQVENQLQRRFDLIPNLVETVKGVAQQEKDVFIGVAQARNQFDKAETVNEKAAAASMVERALGRLIAVREAYPELKSNESFLKLQDQLEGTENRIAVERGRYNDAARNLNAYVRAFPGTIWASLAGVQQAEYFNVTNESAKEAPEVSFSKSE